MFLKKIKFRVAIFLLNNFNKQEKISIDLNQINYLINKIINKIKNQYHFPIIAKNDDGFILKLSNFNSYYLLELLKDHKNIIKIKINYRDFELNPLIIKEELLENIIIYLKN